MLVYFLSYPQGYMLYLFKYICNRYVFNKYIYIYMQIIFIGANTLCLYVQKQYVKPVIKDNTILKK